MIDICLLLFRCSLGGFQGEVKFQLTYSSGGAIDASKALREVNSICESLKRLKIRIFMTCHVCPL